MSVLNDQLTSMLPPGMCVPQPFQQLFDWIEGNGFIFERRDGSLYGCLAGSYSENEAGTEREGGTDITFNAQGNRHLAHWFGNDDPKVLERLCVFARTGNDGSMAAFWLDGFGHQKVVHLGSGSGSDLVCVLANNPVDFLRLIAIGYDEICWRHDLFKEPNADYRGQGYSVCPNVKYQNWVTNTFDVTIPSVATEMIETPSRMGDESSADPFWQWVSTNCG